MFHDAAAPGHEPKTKQKYVKGKHVMRKDVSKQLEGLEKQTNAVLAKRQSDIAYAHQMIEEQKQRKTDAEQAKKTATDSGDLSAFKDAQQQLFDAESTIQFYDLQLDRINQPASVADVTEEDAKKIDAALFECQSKVNLDFEPEIQPVIDELRKIVNSYRDINARIHNCSVRWHSDVLKQSIYELPQKTWMFNYMDQLVRKIDNAFEHRPDRN